MPAILKKKCLAPGYSIEVDTVDEQGWYQILHLFEDANIYQAWSYVAVTSGPNHMSSFVLKKDGNIVAIALVRIVKLPVLNIGIAYIRWGPLWRRRGTSVDIETFRQAVRALRNEYACGRGLVLRIFPVLFDSDPPWFRSILTEEGFSSVRKEALDRTILMDLRPSLDELRSGIKPHWKRYLKVAEKSGLEVIEGTGEVSFNEFIRIYKEMVARKNLEGLIIDINEFREIQSKLPEQFKMGILLAKSEGNICAGLVYSAIGDTAIYLFGATGDVGIRSRGSYLLHWRLIEKLKQNKITVYDLHGINPVKNPGTYRFKSDLGGDSGKDVYFLGRFDSHISVFSHACVDFGDRLRIIYRRMSEVMKAGTTLITKSA